MDTQGGGGGKYINVYPLHEKANIYIYTLIYINIHKLNFYSVFLVNNILVAGIKNINIFCI